MTYYPTLGEDLERAKEILEKGVSRFNVGEQEFVCDGAVYGGDTFAAYKLLGSFVENIEALQCQLAYEKGRVHGLERRVDELIEWEHTAQIYHDFVDKLTAALTDIASADSTSTLEGAVAIAKHALGVELRPEYQFDYTQSKPNRYAEHPKLYEIARDLNFEHGWPWTDPRTGITYQPPTKAEE